MTVFKELILMLDIVVYDFTQNFESVNKPSKIKGFFRTFYFGYLKGIGHEARIAKGKMLFCCQLSAV